MRNLGYVLNIQTLQRCKKCQYRERNAEKIVCIKLKPTTQMVHFGKEPDANDAGCGMKAFFLQ